MPDRRDARTPLAPAPGLRASTLYNRRGWVVIRMKSDWKTVLPPAKEQGLIIAAWMSFAFILATKSA
jgi:hypothetical protein